MLHQFGGKITPQDRTRYQQSPHWQDGRFHNLEDTNLGISPWRIPVIIYKQLKQQPGGEPDSPLPILPFDPAGFLAPAREPKFIWYGHAVTLMRMSGQTLLIDPMLGPDASPVGPVRTRRFSKNTLDLIDDFPEIDLLLLTHDHYDHLDYASIQRLKDKTKAYYVALGVKRHLTHWGIDPEQITEFDWWDEQHFNNIKITFTPTRHFSGRGLTDRTKSLWGGWVFDNGQHRIWFSGDGGYGEHFKTIGERLGPFDFAFLECGQYNDEWRPVHLFPDESIQAALDARAQKVTPFHWAAFKLSFQHTWQEPAEEFVIAAKEQGLPYLLPQLGQCFQLSDELVERWW